MDPGSFNSEAQEFWDFVRCQRPNGTFYGSPSGRCRKGREVGPKEEAPAERSYDDLMAEAEEKRTAGKRALAKDNREEAGRLFKEASAIQEQAIKQKYFSGKDTASPVKPATPKKAPLPPKPKTEEKPKTPGPDAEKTLRNYILGGGMDTGSMLQTNMKLRGLTKTKITPEEQEQVKAVDRLLDTLPRNNGQTHYRGIYLDPVKDKEFISTLKKGGTIRDNGFSSYSRDRDQAEEFADQGIGKPFVIVSKSPTLRDVRKYAPEEYGDQQESIMPRGTPLKISRTETTPDGITYLYTD